MKNRVISKALCIALASALVFGEAAPAMAATDTTDQSQAVISDSTESGAVIYYFSAGASSIIESSNYINIYARGEGKCAKVYINDVLYETSYADPYDGQWDIDRYFYGDAGIVYTIKLVVEGTDGKTVTKSVKRKFAAYGFDKANSTASVSTSYQSDGYYKYQGVGLDIVFKGYMNTEFSCDIYRSTNPNSGYKKIDRVNSYGGRSIWYTDKKTAYGKTYYYKVKLVAVKDTYNNADKVITVSPVIKAAVVNKNTISFTSTLGAKGVDITIEDAGNYNQFEIYRSSQKNGGYKKIKTTTSKIFTDTTVKAGKTYFYKIIPKYYDVVTQKLYSGHVATAGNAGRGVKVVMGTPYVNIEKLSTSSVKLSWDKVRGANVYEIWYRSRDISNDKNRKIATTKGTSYTVKGLTAGESYWFTVKAQSVSGGKVLYENQNSNDTTMEFDGYIGNCEVTSIQTAISKDKQTYVIYTNIVWDKAMGASGYLVKAYNNFTGKTEIVAKLKGATRTKCRFRNPGSKTKGMKYSGVYISAYKGGVEGSSTSSIAVNKVPRANGVKVARKTNGTAVVRWNAVPGATKYSVYRENLQSGNTQWRGEVSSTAFEDKDYSVKTGYKYYIEPQVPFTNASSNSYINFNYEGKSGYAYTYMHKLGAPKMSSAKNTAAKTVIVSWNKVTGAQAYYVYRSTSKNGRYVKVGAVKDTSFVDKKAAKGKTYYYKTASVAVGGNGVKAQSGYSAAVGVKCTK